MGQIRNDGDGFTTTRDANGPPVLRVTGEVDLATAPLLAEAIVDLGSTAPDEIGVDLGGVTFMDSTGLNVLLQARKLFRARFRLIAVSDRVERLLELSGTSDVLGDGDDSGVSAVRD